MLDLGFLEDSGQEGVSEFFALICDDGEWVSEDVAPVGDEVGGYRLFCFVGDDYQLCIL